MTKPKKKFKVGVVANYRQAIKGCLLGKEEKSYIVSDQRIENCELMILTLKVGNKRV